MINIFKKLFGSPSNGFAELTHLHVVRSNDYPCDKCTLESKYCKKLIFSDRTICVMPEDKVVSFRKHEKKSKDYKI